MGESVSLGVDVGSISTKGVLLDGNDQVIAQDYIWTQGDPVSAVQKLIKSLLQQPQQPISIQSVGTTGSARKLIGSMLGADVVKNEITAHVVGTLSRHPDVRTIIEIGGQDSKLILVKDGVISDYAMNTLCAAGTGAFLSSQAKRLGIEVESLGEMARSSMQPAKIAARCTVFAESDMIHKAQIGHSKADLVAGLCAAVVSNYLNNLGKGKSFHSPIVFQGGVSKNSGVVQAFKNELECDIHVDEDSHLMGCIGVAILSRSTQRQSPFDSATVDMVYTTSAFECEGCPNHCEIVRFFRGNAMIDSWGNRCDKGLTPNNIKGAAYDD